MSSHVNLVTLHQTGALFLTASLLEMFPKGSLYGGGGTDRFFYCDCLLPFELDSEILSLLEERVRLLLKKPGEISCTEMMPKNAAHYFSSEGRKDFAETLEDLDAAILTLHRLNGTLIYLPLPEAFVPLKKKEMPPFFRLFLHRKVRIEGREITRILGVWGKEKEEVKERVRKDSNLFFHEEIAEKVSLASFGDSGWLWREKGVQIRQHLRALWQRELQSRNISILSCNPAIGMERGEEEIVKFYLEILNEISEKRVGAVFYLPENSQEGFLSPQWSTSDRIALVASEEKFFEEMISSLQFILQIPKILSFEFEVVVSQPLEAPKKLRSSALAECEKALRCLKQEWRLETVERLPYLARVEVRVRDGLGRLWMGPFLGMVPHQKVGRVLILSLYYSLERMIALLLEQEQSVERVNRKLQQE